MSNIIQFPTSRTPAPPAFETPHYPQAFYLQDKVRLSGGEEGYVFDGKPNFGRFKKWIYYVLVTSGKNAGITKAAYGEKLTLIERSVA